MPIRRIQLLRQTLRQRTFGGPFADWLRNVFAPRCETLAARKIRRCEPSGDFLALEITGVEGVLHVPAGIDWHGLSQCVAEQMYPWQWHYYEVDETRVDGDVVFDIGAAEGLFAHLCRRRAGSVVCFEPLPLFVRGLQRSFSPQDRVTVVAAAVGERESRCFLRENGIASRLTDEVTETPVEVTTVDAFVRRSGIVPGYIKADLEGNEIRLLQGARETIRAHKPRIAITTYHVPTHADEIAALLRELRPDYRMRVKGIEARSGAPVMLHAW